MCHMYAIGMCDLPRQDWCKEGWHVTKKDWSTICKNVTTENEEKHRGYDRTETGEGTEAAKRRRLLEEEVDFNDI